MAQSYETPQPAAALLQLARLRASLSQSQLAERAGVSPTMISAYERGRREPSLPTLTRLVRAAGFDLRIHLAPPDKHDEVLSQLEASRTPSERARRDRQLAAGRQTVPVVEER